MKHYIGHSVSTLDILLIKVKYLLIILHYKLTKKIGKGNGRKTGGEVSIKLKPKESYVIGTYCTNCLQKSKQTKQKDQQPQFRRDLPAEWA